MAGSDYERELLRGMINRICELEGFSNEVDVAGPLKVNPRNVAAWKSRKSVPWLHMEAYCQSRGLSVEWMLYGRGPRNSADMKMEPGAIYKVTTDQDAVYRLSALVHAICERYSIALSEERFSEVVRLLHREAIDNPDRPVSEQKVEALIQLIADEKGEE